MSKQINRSSDRFVSAVVFYMLGSLIFVGLVGIVPEVFLVSKDVYETTIPDNATASGYAVVTYRAGVKIKSRPATDKDLARERGSQRFKLKAMNFILGGGLLIGGLVLVFIGATWLTRGSYPSWWNMTAAVIMGLPGLALLIWCILVFAGKVVPRLDQVQRWTAFRTGILLGGAWIIGSIQLIRSRKGPTK